MEIALPLKVKVIVAPIEFVAMKLPEEYLERNNETEEGSKIMNSLASRPILTGITRSPVGRIGDDR